jgi:hypothetical protein
MYQRNRVTSHGMVCKMLNPGINDQFHSNPENDRYCRNWPCKPRTLQERSTSMHSVPCAYFRVSLRDCAIHSSGWVDFANLGLVGFRFFVRLIKDDASFYRWDHRSFTVCSGVRSATTLRGVRNDILFAPYGHLVPSRERIQGNLLPTHWDICLLKMCIFYSLDRRSEYVFARTWKRTSWQSRRYAGCPWGRHGCSWDAIWVNKCAEKKRTV